MIFRYRLIILLVVFVFSFLYFLPNIYGESPSVTIKTTKLVDHSFIENLKVLLKSENIKFRKLFFEKHEVVIKLYSSTEQLRLRDLIVEKDLPVSIYLNMISNSPTFLKKINAYSMRLGLDLVGGGHLLLKVNISDKVKELSEFYIYNIKSYAKSRNFNFKVKKSLNYNIYMLVFLNENDRALASSFIRNRLYVFDIVEDNLTFLKISLKKEICLSLKVELLEKTMDILSKRIYELGVGNFILKKHGVDKISLELPGVQDVNYIKSMIAKTSHLRFMMVNDSRYSKNKYLKRSEYLNSVNLFTEKGDSVLIENKEVLSGRSIITSSILHFLASRFISVAVVRASNLFNESPSVFSALSMSFGGTLIITCRTCCLMSLAYLFRLDLAKSLESLTPIALSILISS